MPLHILAVNGGSSSIKLALFEVDSSSELCLKIQGGIDSIGSSKAIFHIKGITSEASFSRSVHAPDVKAATELLVTWIQENIETASLVGIGHRVVHGGPNYHQPVLLTSEVLQELQQWSLIDPEHSPGTIFIIERLQKAFPKSLHIACFDTTFHHPLPRVAQLVAIPRSYASQGVRRYGFHGLSCTFLMEELERSEGTQKAQGKIILAHLGNGVSLTAVHNGKSLDTTMGFSPTSGIMMGTRSGDLDPSLPSFLEALEGTSSSDFQTMVNKKSGLRGISETSSDLRDLLALEHEDIRAAEAIALFCYQVKKNIGALAAVLGGLDTLVFAGGTGECAPLIRHRICEGLGFLGIELDTVKNQHNAPLISSVNAIVHVHVMHTDEECVIAKAVSTFL